MSYINKQDAIKLILEERDKVQTTQYKRYGFGVPMPNKTGQHIVGGIRKALRVLETMEVADVEPVRHGHWERIEYVSGDWMRCSACEDNIWTAVEFAELGYLNRFCPNCGAKMGGVSER